MANKLTTCKVCGAEMATNAKACPNCGAKNKKPIYKKWWFYLIIFVVIIGVIAGGSGGSSSEKPSSGSASESAQPEEPTIVYAHYDVTELFDALSDNALKAQNTFKDQYVEIEGFLSTIDSDGKYISVGADPNDYAYFLKSIHCKIQNDEQRAQVMEMSSDDPIVVRGKITDVGEVLGFTLKIDSMN